MITGLCPTCRGPMEAETVSTGTRRRDPIEAHYCPTCDVVRIAPRPPAETRERRDLA